MPVALEYWKDGTVLAMMILMKLMIVGGRLRNEGRERQVLGYHVIRPYSYLSRTPIHFPLNHFSSSVKTPSKEWSRIKARLLDRLVPFLREPNVMLVFALR